MLTFALQGSQKEKGEKGVENISEYTIAENFPNLEKETVIQVQKAQRVQHRINPKRNTPRHTVIKTAKIKDRLLKAAREKQHTRELP